MSDWGLLPTPDDVGDIIDTASGFRASVSIPTNVDGYFGRECPACGAPFKMRADEFEALPDDVTLSCPYCGYGDKHTAFMSSSQRARVTAAVEGLAEQWMHSQVNDMLSKTFGRRTAQPRRSGALVSVEWRYTPGTPPPVQELPAVIHEQTRRIVVCSSCGNHHAVYSATAFCPVCGRRPAADKVLEAIVAAREALGMEDRLGEDEREALRAIGVFERFAVDAIESTVSLFEMFAREQFSRRVADAATHTAGKGNVFQRLDDTAGLFADHAGIDLVELCGEERWRRLKQDFARRHVLTHSGGIVDQKFLDRVPQSGLRLGQRLVVRRADATHALDDLEAIVRGLHSS
jgi:uncharacterized Zn finger protein (UPF0148 family)